MFNKILVLYLLTFSQLSIAQPLNIPGSSETSNLVTSLLQEVVTRSDKYSSLNFVYGAAGDASFAKTQEDLNDGHLDIMWTATSTEYESAFQAIYVPIYRGTLGMRLAIIEQEKLHIFKGIRTLEQLSKMSACQGKLWADTKILEANGIYVAASHKYFNLFPMLEGDRCDYFPRAIFEPWSEIERESQYNLTVDQYVIIKYLMPNLFFVHKDNVTLAMHITEVLTDMQQDGTFDKLFFADADVKNALMKSNLEQRHTIELQNPYVSDEVANIEEVWWFDPLNQEINIASEPSAKLLTQFDTW